jgi:hypothetical protein
MEWMVKKWPNNIKKLTFQHSKKVSQTMVNFYLLKNRFVWRDVFGLFFIFFIGVVLCLYYSRYQPLDADEGHYLTALKLQSQGLVSGVNFYNNASPLFLAILKLIGFVTNDFLGTRYIISIVSFTLISIAIFLFKRGKIFNYSFLIILMANGYFFSQLTQIKHYAITFFLSSFYLLLLIKNQNLCKTEFEKRIYLIIFFGTLLCLNRPMLVPSVIVTSIIYFWLNRFELKIDFKKLFKIFSVILTTIFFVGCIIGSKSISEFLNIILNPIQIISLYQTTNSVVNFKDDFLRFFTVQNFLLLFVILYYLFKNKFKNIELLSYIYCCAFIISFLIFYYFRSPSTSFIHYFHFYIPFLILASISISRLTNVSRFFFFLVYIFCFLMIDQTQFRKLFIGTDVVDSCGYNYSIRTQSPDKIYQYSTSKKLFYRQIDALYATKETLKEVAGAGEVLSWITAPVAMTDIKMASGFESGIGTNELIWTNPKFNKYLANKLHLITKEGLISNIKQKVYAVISTDPYTEPDVLNVIRENYFKFKIIGKKNDCSYTLWIRP